MGQVRISLQFFLPFGAENTVDSKIHREKQHLNSMTISMPQNKTTFASVSGRQLKWQKDKL